MAGRLLYYFNIVPGNGATDGKSQFTEAQLRALWTEMEKSIDLLQPMPSKMYNEGLFTFNNMLIVIPPEDVPKALDELYKMPEGYNKRLLLKLADTGTSLVPCEEPELLAAWRQNENEMTRKEQAGETISAEEIGRQSVYLLTRNKVVGQVISQTLFEGEAGILFFSNVNNLKGIMVNYFRSALGLNVIEMNPRIR